MDLPKKLDCLDGLRAVAVLQVILFHHRLVGQYQDVLPGSIRAWRPADSDSRASTCSSF